MMTTQPSAVTRRKLDVLLQDARSFEEQVAATAHLDQKTVVSKTHPPRQLNTLAEMPWTLLCETWGMKVLGATSALFFAVEVPPGWLLQPAAAGSQWSVVRDARQRERATLFHRAATDVRCTTFFIRPRYGVVHHYNDPTDMTVRIVSASDEQRIFREFGRVAADDPHYRDKVLGYTQLGELWLDQELPGWRDPFAYWDRP